MKSRLFMGTEFATAAAGCPCGKAESAENVGFWTCLAAEIDPNV
jgi:hypothetical protein